MSKLYNQATHEKVTVINPGTDEKEIRFRKKEKIELPVSKTIGGMTKKTGTKSGGKKESPFDPKLDKSAKELTAESKGFAKGGRAEYSKGTMPARNKKNFRSTKSGAGMTQAGVKAYRRLNPGSKLKTAVTGKVKPGSKAAKRRKSYCARSLGQLKRASAKTRNDPNSRIRQARRRWKC